MRNTRVEDYVIVDHDLNIKRFENFERALDEAFRLTDFDRMTYITLPDGRRFSLLEVPH